MAALVMEAQCAGPASCDPQGNSEGQEEIEISTNMDRTTAGGAGAETRNPAWTGGDRSDLGVGTESGEEQGQQQAAGSHRRTGLFFFFFRRPRSNQRAAQANQGLGLTCSEPPAVGEVPWIHDPGLTNQ